MAKPKLLVFASGTKDGGGSGFRKLKENSPKVLQADIVGVVSNHARGGVWQIAQELKVPFFHFPKPYIASQYDHFVTETGAEWVALSGWLKLTKGLDPTHTVNIHPGLLPVFGGAGMYGHYVHEAVMAAYRQGQITHSAVCMHFVTEKFDEGPVFFHYPVIIYPDDTPDTLAQRVNKVEHGWQSWITSLVVNGQISWDGEGPVAIPEWYSKEGFCPLELRDP